MNGKYRKIFAYAFLIIILGLIATKSIKRVVSNYLSNKQLEKMNAITIYSSALIRSGLFKEDMTWTNDENRFDSNHLIIKVGVWNENLSGDEARYQLLWKGGDKFGLLVWPTEDEGRNPIPTREIHQVNKEGRLSLGAGRFIRMSEIDRIYELIKRTQVEEN